MGGGGLRGRGERAFNRSDRGYEVSRAAGLVRSHLHPVVGLGKMRACRVGLENWKIKFKARLAEHEAGIEEFAVTDVSINDNK